MFKQGSRIATLKFSDFSWSALSSVKRRRVTSVVIHRRSAVARVGRSALSTFTSQRLKFYGLFSANQFRIMFEKSSHLASQWCDVLKGFSICARVTNGMTTCCTNAMIFARSLCSVLLLFCWREHSIVEFELVQVSSLPRLGTLQS